MGIEKKRTILIQFNDGERKEYKLIKVTDEPKTAAYPDRTILVFECMVNGEQRRVVVDASKVRNYEYTID